MKYIDAELIKSTKGLYNDIDSCIDELIKARVGHNQENEGKALFRMEGLMVATLQQLDCIIDSLQQEQQEIGLEEFTQKMDDWKARYNHPDNIPIKATMAFTARMFYQYPNVAREWYDSLPKVIQD